VFPTSLSPSRTSDFLQCPLLYRLRTIDQLPDQPSAAAVRGTLVHKVLERLFDLPSGDRTVVGATEIVHEEIHILRTECPGDYSILTADLGSVEDAHEATQHLLKPIEPLLSTYFAMEDPNRLEPFAREMALSVEIADSFSIRGFIDRVDKAPNGDIRVVDYKTGKAPGERFAHKALFQMKFYALAWWRLTNTVPTMLQLMYLGNSRYLRYQPDQSDLIAIEKRLLALRSAIGKAAERGDFRPQPSTLCSWCSYKSLCPEFGGTPPELPPRETWASGSSLVDQALQAGNTSVLE